MVLPDPGAQVSDLGKLEIFGTTENVQVPPFDTTAETVSLPPCGGTVDCVVKLTIFGAGPLAPAVIAGTAAMPPSSKREPRTRIPPHLRCGRTCCADGVVRFMFSPGQAAMKPGAHAT